MKQFRRQTLWTGIILTLLCCTQAVALDKHEVVRKATAAYYSLERQGLTSFNCTVVPDWQEFFEQQLEGYDDPATRSRIGKIRFSVSLDQSGMLDLTPYREGGGTISGSSAYMANKLGELLSGFFQMVQMNVIKTPFSILENDFTLTDKKEEYLITMDDSEATSEITMTRDYLITEILIRIKNPQTAETIFWPKFDSTGQGLLLSRLTTIRNDGQFMSTWDLKYSKTGGLQLPASVVIKNTEKGKTVRLKVDFDNCKAAQKQK
ncbi:MAG: hypothetical protein HXX17_01970 [Geobacteraceae bacterium]|nr:hypothetical protein [Geobacteraceae bacterium]